MEENKEIEILIDNNSGGHKLIVKNIGNTRYDGVLNLNLAGIKENETLLININLTKDKDYEYPLDYLGEYNLTVYSDSEKLKEFNGISLTGYSVFINGKASIYFLSFILVIGLIGVFVWKRKEIIEKVSEYKSNLPRVKTAKNKNSNVIKVKRAYMGMFSFEKTLPSFDKICRKHGLNAVKAKNNLYFILFYGDSKKSNLRLFNIAKELRDEAKKNNIVNSIVLNSEKFVNSAKFLKEFSQFNQKLINLASQNILISESVFKNLDIKTKIHSKKISVDDRSIKAYLFK